MSSAPGSRIKMSELARLAGVPAPTIKHYIREGLVPGPAERTSRNMAWYDAAVADRVRAIKDLQQTRFLPLHVIGQLLEPAPSAKLRSDLDGVARRQLGQFEPSVRSAYDGSAPQAELDRDALLAQLEITAAELDELARLGLVAPEQVAPGRWVYGVGDLSLLRVIDDARRKGLGAVFPLSILGPYLTALRAMVQAELALFRERVLGSPLPESLTLDGLVHEAARLSEQLVIELRRKLIVEEMRTSGAAAGPERPARRRRRR
jgi:DNA-binding transcriptional MerR regulator